MIFLQKCWYSEISKEKNTAKNQAKSLLQNKTQAILDKPDCSRPTKANGLAWPWFNVCLVK
jgi:hypothetical protein